MLNDWRESQELNIKLAQARRERKKTEKEPADKYHESASKICLYFITFCSTTFAFIAASILHNQDVVFNYRWLILFIIAFLFVAILSSLQTLHRNSFFNNWFRKAMFFMANPLYHFKKMKFFLVNPLYHFKKIYVAFRTFMQMNPKMKYFEAHIIDSEEIPEVWECCFKIAKVMFFFTVALFLTLLFSLLFTEPTKQKITEQPTTTATQAKTSYHIQVIPKNCGQPLIPSLIYC